MGKEQGIYKTKCQLKNNLTLSQMYEITLEQSDGKRDRRNGRNEWNKAKSKGTVYKYSTLVDKVASQLSTG